MAGIVCLVAETVSSTGSVWYVGSFKLCCEILLLLNIADIDCLLYYFYLELFLEMVREKRGGKGRRGKMHSL